VLSVRLIAADMLSSLPCAPVLEMLTRSVVWARRVKQGPASVVRDHASREVHSPTRPTQGCSGDWVTAQSHTIQLSTSFR
jgi:hypothetical protein